MDVIDWICAAKYVFMFLINANNKHSTKAINTAINYQTFDEDAVENDGGPDVDGC